MAAPSEPPESLASLEPLGSSEERALPDAPAEASCRNPATLVDAREPFQALVETIWRLRQPDGCPWDKVQTHESIASSMVEEAYEALQCIEDGDVAHLREELCDVLMQVVLHAQIAADAGEFTVADVAAELNEKLIRRHPHVFGDLSAANATDVQEIWDQVKLKEKEAKDAKDAAAPEAAPDGSTEGGGVSAPAAPERPAGLLDDVPRSFPSLLQAQKVSRKAAAAGFEWETTEDVWAQVESERAEFEAEAPGSPERAMEFGDLLFALVNVARREHIDAEEALRASTNKFRARWAAMEDAAYGRGARVEELSTAQLNALWDEVKRGEGAAAAAHASADSAGGRPAPGRA